MKKIILLFLVVIISLAAVPIKEGAQAKVRTDVYHLFTHALVAYPTIAFDKNNIMSTHYDRDCLTADEFKKILQQLYEKDFVLVSTTDLYYYDGKKIVQKHTDFGGKKPDRKSVV